MKSKRAPDSSLDPKPIRARQAAAKKELGKHQALAREVADLRSRLGVAQETLRAINAGEVDTVVVAGQEGDKVFTLKGAEQAYRMLIEAMNEGALMLTTDKTILFANRSFAKMVKCPLEEVTGSSFRRFLSEADRDLLRPLMNRAAKVGTKLSVNLLSSEGMQTPVQISIREVARGDSEHKTISMVVTDLTEARRTEELLRGLSQRLVQVQESERESVALELHDHISQLLCAALLRSQTVLDTLSGQEGQAKEEAINLRELIGGVVKEVERISGNLRPNVIDQLGLADAIQSATAEFAKQTGLRCKLPEMKVPAQLPSSAQMTLYRIFQEALSNVEKHAHASCVTVRLTHDDSAVEMAISDDGAGFDAKQHELKRQGRGILGLVGMRERANAAGGVFSIRSGVRVGTEVRVRIPLPPVPNLSPKSA